ncbi:MAG: hypothetical protein EAZ85_07325 [Bacteroidetes bacterium]|nr:MAG: hypothetical protein EAZ85_07325 [Bacteroidota bacterium]TAG89456.1 MAG: hypothetical protein EAZ20_06395 [Bacteroidota bacterium]
MIPIMSKISYTLLHEAELFIATRHAHVYWIENQKAIVCQAITDYIPHQEFQYIFNEILEFATENPTEMFIFDKSALVTFHQDSVRFFYFDWKPKMEKLGTKIYKHILPNNRTFKVSLDVTKDILRKEKPEICIDVPCIEYIESIDEAFH